MHKGRGMGFIIVVMSINILFSLVLLFFSFIMSLIMVSVSSMTFLVFSILDLSIWAYLIYTLSTSSNSFVRKKKRTTIVA
jgi:hypothetical protein